MPVCIAAYISKYMVSQDLQPFRKYYFNLNSRKKIPKSIPCITISYKFVKFLDISRNLIFLYTFVHTYVCVFGEMLRRQIMVANFYMFFFYF